MTLAPPDLLGTTWRRRSDGEVATVWRVDQGPSAIHLTEADWSPAARQTNAPTGTAPKKHTVTDEQALRREWEEVRRGWVALEPGGA